MSGTVSVDGRGRIYLPKAVRERYGDRYRLVEAHDELLLIPVPADPLAAFQEDAALADRDVAAVKEDIRAEAAAEAGDDVR